MKINDKKKDSIFEMNNNGAIVNSTDSDENRYKSVQRRNNIYSPFLIMNDLNHHNSSK